MPQTLKGLEYQSGRSGQLPETPETRCCSPRYMALVRRIT